MWGRRSRSRGRALGRGGPKPKSGHPTSRRLTLEPLEERRLLSLLWEPVRHALFPEDDIFSPGKSGAVVQLNDAWTNDWRGYHTDDPIVSYGWRYSGAEYDDPAYAYAYAELPPADSYRYTIEYDLYSDGLYGGSKFGWEAGTDEYPMRILHESLFTIGITEKPLTLDDLDVNYPWEYDGRKFMWSGSKLPDGVMDHNHGLVTVTAEGDGETPRYLNLAIHALKWVDGLPSPARFIVQTTFPYPNHYGVFTIRDEDLSAGELSRQQDGSVDFTYNVDTGDVPDIPVSFYWAKGKTQDTIIGGLDKPIYEYALNTSSRKAVGEHNDNVSAAVLKTKPSDASYLLMIVDPKGKFGEEDRSNNLAYVSMVGLSPLKLEVVGGQLKYNEQLKRHESTTTQILIGMDPEPGETFEPYAQLEGSAWYTNKQLHMQGTFYPVVDYLSGVSLFTGNIDMVPGNAISYSKIEDPSKPPNSYKIAGAEVSFTGVQFSRAGVGLQGKITLPPALGSVEIAIADKNWLNIGPDGATLTGIRANFDNVEIGIPNPSEEGKNYLTMIGRRLSVEYVGPTKNVETGLVAPEKFILRGLVRIPEFGNVLVDFSEDKATNQDYYIQFSNGQVELAGRIVAGPIEFVKDKWVLEQFTLEVDTKKATLKGGGEMTIPLGFSIGGELGFLGDSLNYVKLLANNLNKPIFTSGAYLQGISGQIDHMATADPKPLEFGGSVDVTYGPELSLELPDWAGGEFEGSLIRLNADAKIDREHLVTTGKVYVFSTMVENPDTGLKQLDGVAVATGQADLNWKKGTLEVGGTFDLLKGLVKADLALNADSSYNFTASGGATVSAPDIKWSPWKGQQLGNARTYLQYRNDNDPTNDYIAAWGSADLPVLGRTHLGFKVDLDGNWDFFSDLSAVHRPITDQVAMAATGAIPSAAAIPDGTEKTILYVEWENDIGPVGVEVVSPGGTVFDATAIDAHAEMALLPELSGATYIAVGIANPAPGQWQIRPADTTGLGQVHTTILASSAAPSFQFTHQSDTGSAVWLYYDVAATDQPVEVTFFYDDDASGADGSPLVRYSSTRSYTYPAGYSGTGLLDHGWESQGYPPGDYFIYACVSDGIHAPQFIYADDPVTWEGTPPHFQGTGPVVESVAAGDILEVHWDSAVDRDDQPITYSLPDDAPAGVTLDPQGRLTYETDGRRLDSYHELITVLATDGSPYGGQDPYYLRGTFAAVVYGQQTASGTVDQANLTEQWSRGADAGQHFFYSPANWTAEGLQVQITGPSGAVLFEGPANQEGDFVATEDGLLEISIAISGTGDGGFYEFRVDPVIEPGEWVEGQLKIGETVPESSLLETDLAHGPIGETLAYRFYGTEGQQIVFDRTDSQVSWTDSRPGSSQFPYQIASSFSPDVRLVGPDGKMSVMSRDTLPETHLTTIPAEGWYTLWIKDDAPTDHVYDSQTRFRLLDVADATTLQEGQTFQLDLNAQEAHVFQFEGTAGEWFYGDLLDEPNHMLQNLYAYGILPNGVPADSPFAPETWEYLDATGTYTWVVESRENESHPIERAQFQSTKIPLTLNQVVDGPLVMELLEYTFTGTERQVLFHDHVDLPNSHPPDLFLVGPSGLVDRWKDDKVLVLPESGDYSLFARSWGSPHRFVLQDVPVSNAQYGDQIYGETSPDWGMTVLAIQGTAGDAFSLEPTRAVYVENGVREEWPSDLLHSLSTWVTLYGPDKEILSEGAAGLTASLPTTGTYIATIAKTGWSSADSYAEYDYLLTKETIVESPLPAGTVLDTYVSAGEQHQYNFSGQAGEKFAFNTIDLDEELTGGLYSPSGQMLGDLATIAGSPVIELPADGQYELTLDSVSGESASYEFQLTRIDDQPAPLAPGMVEGSLSREGETAWYYFDAQAGQRLNVHAEPPPAVPLAEFAAPLAQSEGEQPDVNLAVFDPQMGYLFMAPLGEDFEVPLPETGRYYVQLMSGEPFFEAPYRLQLTLKTPVNRAPQAVDDKLVVYAGEPATIEPLTNDLDVDGDALTLQITQPPQFGDLAPLGDGVLLYTPRGTYAGADSFRYLAFDGEIQSAEAIVVVSEIAQLGTIDSFAIGGQDPSNGPVSYTFENFRPGILSVQVSTLETTGVSLSLYDRQNQQVPLALTQSPSGMARLDWNVAQAGQEFLVVIDGDTSSAELRIGNQVDSAGSTFNVHGTAGADTFTFDASASQTIGINGVEYHFDDDRYESIVFNGSDGADSATLTGGPDDEIARFFPDHGTFGENGFLVTLNDVSAITAHGGGGADSAFMYDSPGDDRFVSRKGYGRLSGDGFAQETFDFMYNYGYAVTKDGGTDVAILEDTPGADKFKFDWPKPGQFFGKMYGGGQYYNRAKLFEQIEAVMTDGKNQVRLFDSEGDDTFFGQKDESRLIGPSFDVTVTGYDTLIAYSSQGNDIANLDDSADDDTTRARPHKVIFWGGDDADPTYEITARKFDEYHFEAKHGGYDRAKLHDTALDDHVNATGNSASLYKNSTDLDLLYEVVAFEWVKLYATSNGSHDTLKKVEPLDFDLIYSEGAWDELP